ncbi:MAG: hypothetical protein NTV34_08080 [Proteobacteria bacterium]|nr:hypothetical protein [Pseudomonadota bacterium]
MESRNAIKLSFIVVITSMSLNYGCKKRQNSDTKDSKKYLSTESLSGIVAVGKGFDIVTNEVKEATCVVGDTGQNTVNNADGGASGLASQLALEGYGIGEERPSLALGADQSGSSHVDLHYARSFKKLLQALDATIQSETGFTRGDDPGLKKQQEYLPAPLPKTFGSQGGASLEGEGDAGQSTEAGAARTEDSFGSASAVANFKAKLSLAYEKSDDVSFILLHGVKTFPPVSGDTVSDPMLSDKYSKAVFDDTAPDVDETALDDSVPAAGNGPENAPENASGGAKPVAKKKTAPQSQDQTIAQYSEFRNYCGDYYVESIVRGREIWFVAVMKTARFDAAFNAVADLADGAGIKNKKIGDAETSFKAQESVDLKTSFLTEQVEIKTASRGSVSMNFQKFSFAEALTSFNSFLSSVEAAKNADEGVLGVKINDYNNVRFNVGTKTSRLGNLFTSNIKTIAADTVNVVDKVTRNELWANDEIKRLQDDYMYGQWNLEPDAPNGPEGIASQALKLMSFSKQMARAKARCAGVRDVKNLPDGSCEKDIREAAAIPRPVITRPALSPSKVAFIFPKEVIAAGRAGKLGNNAAKGSFDKETGVSQDQARQACKKIGGGWVLPNQADWNAIVQASANYTRWMAKTQGNAYRLNDDMDPLALPCGLFNEVPFWSDTKDKVAVINKGCVQGDAYLGSSPKSFERSNWLFWTRKVGNYACVKYTHAK